jgi:cell division protein FtsB
VRGRNHERSWVEWARAALPPRLVRRYRASAAFRRRTHRVARWSWVLVLGWAFVFGDNGLAAVLFRWVRIQKLQREVAALERHDRWLQAEVERRENDPRTLERLARERCGLAYAGEKVYRIVEVSPGEARRLERERRSLAKLETRSEGQRAGAGSPPAPIEIR